VAFLKDIIASADVGFSNSALQTCQSVYIKVQRILYQNTCFGFDASVFGLFESLFCGGSLPGADPRALIRQLCFTFSKQSDHLSSAMYAMTVSRRYQIDGLLLELQVTRIPNALDVSVNCKIFEAIGRLKNVKGLWLTWVYGKDKFKSAFYDKLND
jgi:hypothetical protein